MIQVSTVVNGRTISTAHQEVTKEQERLPVETLDVLKPKDVDLKFIEENHVSIGSQKKQYAIKEIINYFNSFPLRNTSTAVLLRLTD